MSNQYERTVDIPSEQSIDSTKLTFYRNAQDLFQVASWVDNDAHYYVAANLTTHEIEKIVEEYSVNKE